MPVSFANRPETPPPPPDPRANDVTPSDCPSPLSWRDVVQRFRQEAKPFDVDRNGVRISCRAWGQGPPIYFLNGWNGTQELFALIGWLLRDDFRCVFHDYAGTGHGSIKLEDLVADLFAVADHCGDETFSLYGASLGGAIGLAAMIGHPKRISRAMIQAAFAHRKLSRGERALIRPCKLLWGRLRQVPLRAVVQRSNHAVWFPPYDFERFQFLLDDTGDVRLATLAQRAEVVRDLDLRGRLQDIQVPVLLVRTEGEGRVVARCQEELEQGLPDACTQWLDNTGQFPFLTHPHRLAKLVRSFLAATPQCVEAGDG